MDGWKEEIETDTNLFTFLVAPMKDFKKHHRFPVSPDSIMMVMMMMVMMVKNGAVDGRYCISYTRYKRQHHKNTSYQGDVYYTVV